MVSRNWKSSRAVCSSALKGVYLICAAMACWLKGYKGRSSKILQSPTAALCSQRTKAGGVRSKKAGRQCSEERDRACQRVVPYSGTLAMHKTWGWILGGGSEGKKYQKVSSSAIHNARAKVCCAQCSEQPRFTLIWYKTTKLFISPLWFFSSSQTSLLVRREVWPVMGGQGRCFVFQYPEQVFKGVTEEILLLLVANYT